MKRGRQPGTVVLAGGGIDSTVCLYELQAGGSRVRALHVDFGQRAAKAEWTAVKAICAGLQLESTQIIVRGNQAFGPGEIPGRNAALVFLALMHLRPEDHVICLGIHAGTRFPDCSSDFFQTISTLVAEHTDSRVRVVAPLLTFQKSEIVAVAQARSWSLARTYSCQRGRSRPCGVCLSCRDRKAIGC